MTEVSTATPGVASEGSPILNWLTVAEAGQIIRRKPWPIVQAIEAGELRASMPGNDGCWLIRPEDLVAYVDRYATDVPDGPLMTREERRERALRAFEEREAALDAGLARLLDITPDAASNLTANELDAMAADRGMKASELIRLAVSE